MDVPQHKEAVLNAENRQTTNSQRAFPLALDLETRIALLTPAEISLKLDWRMQAESLLPLEKDNSDAREVERQVIQAYSSYPR
jgi:hypothetical protein